MAEENKKGEEGKGFAGLSSLVSDVESAVADAKRAVSNPSGEDTGSHNVGSGSPSATSEESETEHQPHPQATQQPPDDSSTGKLLLGFGAVIGVFWLFWAVSENKGTPNYSAAYSTAPAPPLVDTSRTANSSQQTFLPAPTAPQAGGLQNAPGKMATTRTFEPAPSQPQESIRPIEEKPPVGRNNILGAAQIRYCLSEKIRVEASKEAVNNLSETDVDQFNTTVTDYNSRCGAFQYRRGTLEAVQSEVERNRQALEAEGRRRFARSQGVKTRQQPRGYSSQVVEQGQDRANFQTCISGNMPFACNHSLLTDAEATQVAAAEHRANFQTCISGNMPFACNHSLLTETEAAQVEAAERQANFQTCVSGNMPFACNHSLLTGSEAAQVQAAERRANFQTCISGNMPFACNHSLLTETEAAQVANAERRARTQWSSP